MLRSLVPVVAVLAAPALDSLCAQSVYDFNVLNGSDTHPYTLLDGWSYRDMWWHTGDPHGAFMARGVHGQALYIDPTAEMVIARFASFPTAGNAAIDPTSLPAYRALAERLLADPR